MERQEVTETVIEMIGQIMLEKKEVMLKHHLENDLSMDSIDFVELGTALEEKYSIDISDEDLVELKTVQMVIDTVLISPIYTV